jgi:hypothetical protein
MRFYWRLVGALLAAALLFGGAQLEAIPTAQAKSDGYFVRECLIPAMTGSGVKGNGCNLYKAPFWVAGQKPIKGAQGNFTKWVNACGQGLVWAVVGIVKRNPKAVVNGVFMGCAQGIGGAALFGA